ncbi:hypothetical protein U9M48_033318 [Paspalum notatum var. saurae]|uniref:GATA-type domain-containing protein n=1 Tax=Paspalum notatum var. saurae TaxID=547442 RepID=A0AAQ3U9D0_PASNO
MLHRTLIPSSSCVSVSASSSSPSLHASNAATAPGGSSRPAMPSYAHHHSSPLDDGRTMDVLKSHNSFPTEETAEEAAAGALGGDKDGFSVEDLLDLEEFGEPDKDGAEHDDDDVPPPPPPPPVAADEKPGEESQPLSAVTYDLPPPPQEMVDLLPAHDVEELEWVSRIMDDSLSELPPQPQPPAAVAAASRPPLAQQQRRPFTHDGAGYWALPPALGPQRTPTICALSTEAMVPVKAKRSKRSRGLGWSLSGASFLSDSSSSSSTATTSSCSSSGSFSPFLLLDPAPFGGLELGAEGYYSHHLLLPPPPSKKSKHGSKGSKHKPKKRGRKPKHLPPHPPAAGGAQPAPGDRRCSHCGVQKTPQWRAGPEGAKTLCNACGVRYKSGRLLPEYRPACSPTFVSSIHSNSHRKVLEMRRKKETGMVATAAPPAVASF